MTAFEVYKVYLAVKLHFTSEHYDMTKGKGGVRCKESTFNKRQDCHFFERLSRKYRSSELLGLFVSHFVSESQFHKLYGDDADDTYKEWKKRIQRMSYTFENDIKSLNEVTDNFDSLFSVNGSGWPKLFDLQRIDDISIETFVIMDKLLDFISQFDADIKETRRWPQTSLTCRKYSKFLQVDESKYRNILRNIVVMNKQQLQAAI